MLEKTIAVAAVVLLTLILVVAVNTANFVPEKSGVQSVDLPEINLDQVSQNLSDAIRFKTVSNPNPLYVNDKEFKDFNNWMVKTYPLAHQVMTRTMIGDLTPLYRWQGKDTSAKPLLFTAHYDVVPVNIGTEKDWTHPPFEGVIADGYVWGRGALDDKVGVVTLMEALEYLAASGFQPQRTLYFSFGHDEEVGGTLGAAAVVNHFQEQGIQFAWSLDEGSMVIDGLIPNSDMSIASINVAEKGFLTLDLKVMGTGGHSSIPPRETAVGILATAIHRLQQNPMDAKLTGIGADFMDSIAPYLPREKRILFANRRIFAPLISAQLQKSPTTDALLRTSIAPTMLSGSDRENVLPKHATATINFRIHPRDTVAKAIEHVRQAIDDERIEIVVRSAREASPVSDSRSEGFQILAASFQEVFGSVIVAPGLTLAGTDSKHYQKVSDNSFRIIPIRFTVEDIKRIHGTDERISIENLKLAVQFYTRLFSNYNEPEDVNQLNASN